MCAFLNSRPVRMWLGGFLHGKQIGTTVFQFMKVPQFDPSDPHCQVIVEIAKTAHEVREGTRAKAFLDDELENQLAEHVQACCKNR